MKDWLAPLQTTTPSLAGTDGSLAEKDPGGVPAGPEGLNVSAIGHVLEAYAELRRATQAARIASSRPPTAGIVQRRRDG